CWRQIEGVVEARGRPAKTSIPWGAMPNHAVEGVRHLVCEEAGQAEQQIPEHRCDDAIAEIFRQTFDGGPRYPMRVEAHRIAADNMPHRCAAPRKPARVQRFCYCGDVFVQAALSDDHCDQQGFDDSTEQMATAESLDHEPQRRGAADQQNYRY